MKSRYIFLLIGALLGVPVSSWAQSISLRSDDVRVIESRFGGYDLWIRQLPGVGSVMLTESTESETLRPDTFALRNPASHPSVADERRILDGRFLDQGSRGYTLIDSTPEPFGSWSGAFHLFVPYVVTYGYPWSRSGELVVKDGTYFSIRLFEKPHGDYAGEYRDQPFILRLVQRAPDAGVSDIYLPDSVDAFETISRESHLLYSEGEADVPIQIGRAVESLSGTDLDLVIVLDTTESMRNDLPFLKSDLVGVLKKKTAGFRRVRIGLVLFRDYNEHYLTRVVDFQDTWEKLQDQLNRVSVLGGKDIPEAVYEALYEAETGFLWSSDQRLIILVGDAPPHSRPRGEVTLEMVEAEAATNRITIAPILLPR